jgi:8-oxo-dGTP diphosphatase
VDVHTDEVNVELRRWMVGGGVLRRDDELLLVQNRRRNGSLDWSTPGGVIDAGESVVEGLSREVHEETGLVISGWTNLAYRVEVTFPDQGWHLFVESHVAGPWSGSLVLDDPDGIVVDARFVDMSSVAEHLEMAPVWVREPLVSWLGGPEGVAVTYRYHVEQAADRSLRVERTG